MNFGLGFAAAKCCDPGLSKFVRHEMISKIPFKSHNGKVPERQYWGEQRYVSAQKYLDCDYSLRLHTETGTPVKVKNLPRTNYVRKTWKAFRSSSSNYCIELPLSAAVQIRKGERLRDSVILSTFPKCRENPSGFLNCIDVSTQ